MVVASESTVTEGKVANTSYSKMSNNVPDKIKPFGTLRHFGATLLGHYET